MRGTVGHIAPEYLSTGQSSEKTDVFGFGILLLELITGQTALEFGKSSNQKGAMLDWVSSLSYSYGTVWFQAYDLIILEVLLIWHWFLFR